MRGIEEEDGDRIELQQALFIVDSPILVIPHLKIFQILFTFLEKNSFSLKLFYSFSCEC